MLLPRAGPSTLAAVRWAFAATAGLVFGSREPPLNTKVVRAIYQRALELGREADLDA